MENKKPKTINTELIYYMFGEIKDEIREMKKDYVTKSESTALKNEIAELRNEIEALKKSRNLIGWLYPTASAAFSAIVTYLLLEFFRTHK